MLGEMFLNSIPFYPYLLGFVGLWTCSYGIWAFINFSSSGKWMYPVGSLSHVGPVCSSCCVAVSSAVHVLNHVDPIVTVKQRQTLQDVSAFDAIHVPTYQS